MKQIAIKLVQWTISLLSWLTISPIFYYLTGRWKLMSKKRRIGLVIISPMFLTIYAFMCLAGLSIYYDYHRKYRFADQDVLTRITGVTYPDFKIIEYGKSFLRTLDCDKDINIRTPIANRFFIFVGF